MERIHIHHPKLRLTAVVPRSTFESGLKAKGWKEGPAPSKRVKSKKESD